MNRFKILRGSALAALAIAACSAPFADTAIKAVGVHIASYHAPAGDFNNYNPGLYLRLNNGFTAGAYYNSERHTSAYAGYTHEWGRLAVTVGAITGYRRTNVMPMVVPSVRLGKIENATFRLAYVPRIERNGAHAIHLTAEF